MGWNIALPDAEWYAAGDERLDGLVREVLDQDTVALDTETTGLVVWGDQPLFWSLAWGDNRRICMPIETHFAFKEAFADPTKRWVFANAKFDMHMMAQVGVDLAGDCVDTQVMHALLYEEESHKLKDMAKSVLGWRWTDFFDTFRGQMVDDTEQKPFKRHGVTIQPKRKEFVGEMLLRCFREDLPKLVDYASNDAYGTLRLYEKLKDELAHCAIYSLYPEWLPTMEHLFFKTEVPFTKVLWQCERNGIYVNREYLGSRREPMNNDHERHQFEMVSIGTKNGLRNFNPDSVDDLREFFIDVKKVKKLMMTKGGKSGVKKASIDKGFLEYYSDYELDEEVAQMATLKLQDAKVTKLMSTYIDGIAKHFDPLERLHTRFNQDVARTGRLSSSNPNLQNVPTSEKDKYQLRGAFRAQPGAGTELIVGDYAQLEMRLLACATVTPQNPEGAKEMIQLFLDGKDIHMGNAAMVYGPIYERQHGWALTYDFLKEAKKIDGKVKGGELPPEARTHRHELALFARNAIKSIGFGLNYGMKEGKLARQLGITKEAAKAIIDAYLGTYPAVQEFYDAAIEETRETGYSFTLLGRRRFHPSIHSYNTMDRWSEERKAVNNQIQGTAADVVRMAMINCSRANLDKKYGCKMLLQVHDELIFECPTETRAAAQAEIKQIMEHPFFDDLKVPLEVSIGSGPSWNQAK
jgi:DNA polymerase-1